MDRDEGEGTSIKEIPYYAIVIKRMWTGVKKDGQNFDVVSIRLNSYNELCRWNYLLSWDNVLESLRTLGQQVTVEQVLKDKGVYVLLSNLGQPFQDLPQISQWWIQVITKIRKYLDAIKIYKCLYNWHQEKIVMLVWEKNDLVKQNQVMLGDADTASRGFSLVGASSKLNAVTLYLMRELRGIEMWTDEGQIRILQFKTDASNLQMMKKFHLYAILKDQMDLDLFIEKDEFFVIGVIKQDLDKIEVLLQTMEWMYRFVSNQVLIDEMTVEMLQYHDNWNYVKEQLEHTGLNYHMEFNAKHVTLFAESDEAANELVKSVTGCFRYCTFKFLKQQEPKNGIDAILEKHGTMVHVELISKDYELCVHLLARADTFEGVHKEINYFKSQLDDQLEKAKPKTKIIEIDKHVYHFLRRHKNEDLEKVKIDVKETSKDRNVMTMHVRGMASAIKSICDMINYVREDLVTKRVTKIFDKPRTDQFVCDLENKYQCSILREESTEASAIDQGDDVKLTYDCQLVTQYWNYKGTSISVITCDINQANVEFVVNPVVADTFGSMEIECVKKWKTVCRLGIPEFMDKGKEKTNLQDAFQKLYKYLKNKLKGENIVAIPVYGVCNWDYKKFVKNLLFPIKSLLPRIMLCVPNDNVKKEVIKIISDAKGGPVNIFVKLGEITKEKVDVIVNTTSKDVEFEIGRGVSLAILKATGENIQKQCEHNNSFGKELPAGEIIVTNGFNLLCKKVYHGALRDWSTDDTYNVERIDEMKTFIRKCLHEAEKDAMKSLSFPTLGTGNLGYPTNQVAEIMLQEIKSFSANQRQDCSLQEVNIVVFGEDHETYEIFKKRYEACVGPLPVSEELQVLPRRTVYMVTGKEQEVDIAIKALTDDNVTKEMEQTEVTDDQNADKEPLKLVEKMTKAEDGYDGKTDEFKNDEGIHSKETDAFGHPGDGYFDRVKEERRAKDITLLPLQSVMVRFRWRKN